ncbi:prepilin peptidase [Couchioplanes caeruleus]|uniref:Prepilin type IV endopeptidase peptidase domain-containing protein n=2 Tax=Couchioplanes caeruleus TaxID=56438 RepID=A0A1K0GNI4_9ACTN|nr:prepilin peptidase [Couchioplanes caeruleus]OJF10763.1 hypothetical protein BG844_30360 [Couchioplanes caeruleus subsp. caeruleus]ROP28132.1 leader peptidase (prepilin peptidase)/N-methyltransferase [Couchioplanes caeruleus]
MDVFAASGLAVAGALAGIPISAISYAAPAHGSLQVPAGWWRGAPARPAAVLAVSLMAGVATWLVAWRLPTTTMPAFWIFAVVGAGLAVIDVRRRRLPYPLVGTAAAASALCFAVDAAVHGSEGSLLRALAAALIAALLMLGVALSFPGQLGLGDVALSGAVTLNLAWLSWQAAIAGMFIAFLLQGVIGLLVRVRTRAPATLPMGPAMWAGWLLAVAVS